MARPKKLEMTALGGLALQLVFLVACVVLGERSNSRAVAAEAWHVAVGLLVWFLVLVHGRQRRLALEEREERERLRATRLSEEIFEETELDTARASAGLMVFEKYFVPFFSVVLSGLLLFFAYRIASDSWGAARYTVEKPDVVAVGMVFISFVGFLIGKYAAGMAQNRGYRLLRAAGGYVMGNVIVAILTAVAMAMYYFGIHWGETVLVIAIPVVMGLVGVEVLLNLLLDIYRPRVAGQETRPPYDSRLLGLFAEPEGVLKTVAATLDYQFGFKVSETWFYHFMERAILPLILVQLASLWLLTTLVVVEQNQIVFIETLGRPHVTPQDAARGIRATVFQPGFYVKAPWPFSVARRIPAYQVHHLEVGKIYEKSSRPVGPVPVTRDPDIQLWRELHIDPKVGFEASFLVPSTSQVEPAEASAGPAEGEGPATGVRDRKVPAVNLARLEAHVYYRIKRKAGGQIDENAAFTYYYNDTDTDLHLEKLAYRAMCRIAASQDFLKWIAADREKVVARYLESVRVAAEEAGLGLEVVDATINAVHPPAEVARAYEQVVAALEQRESLILQGEQESIRRRSRSTARRAELLKDASAYAHRQRTIALADAEKFMVQLDAYRKAPLVYMHRSYFDALEEALEGQKVFIVPVTTDEVQVIDLQEKLRTSILDDLDALED